MNKQKLFASTLTAAMVATAIAPVASANTTTSFEDMNKVSNWATASVNYLKANNVVEGYNNLFNGQDSLTRGEAAKIIATTLKLDAKAVAGEKTFSDISGHWSEEYVKALVNSTKYASVINGYTDGTFKADQVITREELAKMVVVAYDLKLDTTKDVAFSDIDGWAKNYIEVLASNGIVNGTGEGKFSPKTVVTREAAAVFVHRTEVTEIRLAVEDKVLALATATVQGNDKVTFENNTFTIKEGEKIETITFEFTEEIVELEEDLAVNIKVEGQTVPYGTAKVVEGKLVVTPIKNNEVAGLMGEFTFEVADVTAIKSVSGVALKADFKLPTLKVIDDKVTLVDATVVGNDEVTFEENTFTIVQGQKIEKINFELSEKIAKLEKPLNVSIKKGETSVPYGTADVVEGNLVVTPLENNEVAGVVGSFTFEVEGLETIKSVDGVELSERFILPVLKVVKNELKLKDAKVAGNDKVTFKNNAFTIVQGEKIETITFEFNKELEKIETELEVSIKKGEAVVPYGTADVVEGKLVVTPIKNNEVAGIVGEFTFEVKGLEALKSADGALLDESFVLPTLVVENNDLTLVAAKIAGDAAFAENTFTMEIGKSITSITFSMNEDVAAFVEGSDIKVALKKGETLLSADYGTLSVVDGDIVLTPSTNNGTAGLVGEFTFEISEEIIKSLDGSVLSKDFVLPKLVVTEAK